MNISKDYVFQLIPFISAFLLGLMQCLKAYTFKYMASYYILPYMWKLVILLCMQRSICKAVHDYPPAIQ